MALDKAIQHGKEHRAPYYDSRRIDTSCRHRGGCAWCESQRTFRNRRKLLRASEMQREASQTAQN